MAEISNRVRRRGIRWAYANAFVWALGNGFVSTPFVVYLAQSLGAQGIEVGLVIAAPNFAGLLRLFAPSLMQACGKRRPFVIVCYILSSIVLLLLAKYVIPTTDEARPYTLTLLVVLWSAYHVFEYLGTVALWTWLGDLTPIRIRGRFLGRREFYLLAGRVAGMALAGEFVAEYQLRYPNYPAWIAYALPAWSGAWLMLVAALLLCFVPALERPAAALAPVPWRSLLAALTNRRNWPLLAYTSWFSFFNGVTGVAQNIFVAQQLGLELRLRLLLEGVTRLGQIGLATETGRWVDRFGNKPVMVVSQLFVAASLAFFVFANAGERWLWVAGAWIFWIAYVGLNVAFPNVMLRLAPRRDVAGYVAVNHTFSGLFVGCSILAGGWLLDVLKPAPIGAPLEGVRQWLASVDLTRFQAVFLFGMCARAAGVFWILRLDDRPADEHGHVAPAGAEKSA